MTHWTIVRHGTTVWMEEHRFHGSLDSPLSAKGRDEARRTAEVLATLAPYDALYTSPAGRAHETADIIGAMLGLTPQVDERLREMNFGWVEGHHTPNLQAPARGWGDKLVRRLWRAWFHLNTEPWPPVRKRVEPLIADLRARHPDGRIVTVSHYFIHSALLTLLCDPPPARGLAWHHIRPAGFTEVEVDGDHRGTLLRQDVGPSVDEPSGHGQDQHRS